MWCLVFIPILSLAPQAAAEPSVFGLELPVSDVARSAASYEQAFGFELVFHGGEIARLEKDGLVLVLVASTDPPPAPDLASVHLNLEAADLARGLERALAAGMLAPELEPETIPIGLAHRLVDPDGHVTHLIDLDPDQGAGTDALGVFNVGLNLEPGADWEFVERLGFAVLTRAYLPDVLPIAKRGAAELVLHRTASGPRAAGQKSAALLLGVASLASAEELLRAAGCLPDGVAPRPSPLGRRLALEVPSRLRVELVERSPAQLAFERLASLAGSWEGRSSAGWTARAEIEVIARGSAVLERTNFEAHPGETMLTLFHRDGEALLLTHYCVAGNQPRLVASALAGDELAFTFRDATNLEAPEQGHMHACRLRFEGDDAFSSQWSFFSGGRESWMEQIAYRRAPGAGRAPGATR